MSNEALAACMYITALSAVLDIKLFLSIWMVETHKNAIAVDRSINAGGIDMIFRV